MKKQIHKIQLSHIYCGMDSDGHPASSATATRQERWDDNPDGAEERMAELNSWPETVGVTREDWWEEEEVDGPDIVRMSAVHMRVPDEEEYVGGSYLFVIDADQISRGSVARLALDKNGHQINKDIFYLSKYWTILQKALKP